MSDLCAAEQYTNGTATMVEYVDVGRMMRRGRQLQGSSMDGKSHFLDSDS